MATEIKNERRCENWLETFLHFSTPRTESPSPYVLWTGLFTLAATLRRRVIIPASGVLGGWSCTPHLYVMLVGPPGLRKTTAMEAFGIPLLEQVVPELTSGPTFATKEAIIQQIVGSKDASMYMTVTEFGDIMQKNGPEMYDFFTSMFDGKRKIESRTIGRGIELADKPCVNLLAATTPHWISNNMPESAIGGGFASRVIFIYADRLAKKQLFYRDIDTAKIARLEQDLVHDLSHIAANMQGEFTLEEDAFEYLEDWYQKRPDHAPNPKIEGYWQRKPTHTLKVAMLHSAATKDELKLTVRDIKFALDVIGATETDLLKVFEGVGKNEYTYTMNDIFTYIQDKKKVSQAELIVKFKADAEPMKLLQLLHGITLMGDVKTNADDRGELWYYIPENP